jgi:Flp pilus assembly protein TadB
MEYTTRELKILMDERDKRYAEVNIEREKALAILKEADNKALELAREIQIYKDEKANELREQINSERGLYVTHAELKPLMEFVLSQQGSSSTSTKLIGYMFAAAGLATAIVTTVLLILR